MNKYINTRDWSALQKDFLSAKPFNHIVIDNFFTKEVLVELVNEFPAYNSSVWGAVYNNAIENKKACNSWSSFPKTTYSTFNYLCSSEIEQIISTITGTPNIQADIGLHGGGWHVHNKGGKLNIHLDYSIHPKLGLERHYNLIIYLTPDWQQEWGGGLELWTEESGKPKECVKYVENIFNRAVLFDTTQQSWHGLPKELRCPENTARQSLAVYYMTEPSIDANKRNRALFAPYKEQATDAEVLDLIIKRSK